jgi:hypothetical protein
MSIRPTLTQVTHEVAVQVDLTFEAPRERPKVAIYRLPYATAIARGFPVKRTIHNPLSLCSLGGELPL